MRWLKRLLGGSTSNQSQVPLPGTTKWKPILSLAELAGEIRALIVDGREPSVQELRALEDRFSRNLASEAPHFIGHWFADADIRQRDSDYRNAQALQLEVALREMEVSRGTTTAISSPASSKPRQGHNDA